MEIIHFGWTPTNATRLFSPLHRIFYVSIVNWNRERKLWMSHLNISFADRGMMPSSLFRNSESISISKSWLPSMVCVLPDPVCPYAMMHTLYLFSEHTISSIKCSKIHTASSACLNDNKHYWLHIEDIQVKQKYVYVVVNFLSQVIFMFFFVSTSLAYITIPKKQRKHKNNLG